VNMHPHVHSLNTGLRLLAMLVGWKGLPCVWPILHVPPGSEIQAFPPCCPVRLCPLDSWKGGCCHV
jgi:hypothetical protein